MTKGLAYPVLLCPIAVAFLVTRADTDGQRPLGVELRGWSQERKVIKSISIPLSDTSIGFDPVKGSGDVVTIAGITDMGDTSPVISLNSDTGGIAGAPSGSDVDPQDLSAPELTIEQLTPALPIDRGRVGTSGKYPVVQSLQARHPRHAVNLPEADGELTGSMAQLPSAAP